MSGGKTTTETVGGALRGIAKGFYMSLSMFSAIPLPKTRWDETVFPLMLPSLPLVGIIIGAMWLGVGRLLILCGLHMVLAAAILSATPFALTGFLHLDGYMDTSDAALSGRELKEKIRILKDPHTGSFAVIMLALLFLLQFASAYALLDRGGSLNALLIIPVISRCFASLSLLLISAMPQSSYAPMFSKDKKTSHIVFLIILLALALALAYPVSGLAGLAAAGVSCLTFVAALLWLYHNFRGISGDLAGFSICASELAGLIALSVF